MQKYPVLVSLLSKWFHCIGMNYCHSLLIKLYLITFNIANVIVVGYIDYVNSELFLLCMLLHCSSSGFLCLRLNVQILDFYVYD